VPPSENIYRPCGPQDEKLTETAADVYASRRHVLQTIFGCLRDSLSSGPCAHGAGPRCLRRCTSGRQEIIRTQDTQGVRAIDGQNSSLAATPPLAGQGGEWWRERASESERETAQAAARFSNRCYHVSKLTGVETVADTTTVTVNAATSRTTPATATSRELLKPFHHSLITILSRGIGGAGRGRLGPRPRAQTPDRSLDKLPLCPLIELTINLRARTW